MHFAHDTEYSLSETAALINTAPSRFDETEDLVTIADLDEHVGRWGWTGLHAHTRDELEAVKALRPRLRELWLAADEERVEGLNAMLREAGALPQLVRHDQWDWHLHATAPDAPLAVRMAVEAAMALVDVVRSGETSRLAVCAAPDCDDVLIDLSRNHSRRYCDSGCGNRMAAAAYRARRAAGETAELKTGEQS